MVEVHNNFNYTFWNMLRSPKSISSSNPDLPSASTASESDLNITMRKRKQPACEFMDAINSLQLEVRNQMNILRENMSSNFTIMSDNFKNLRDDLDSFKSEFKKELNELRSDQNPMKQQMEEFSSTIKSLETSAQFTSDQNELITKRVDDLSNRSKRIENTDIIVSNMEMKINTLEQQARQCNLEIANVPERRAENLLAILENLGNQINCQITKADVISVHRVPRASRNDKPKNIIVKFSTRILRDNILSSFRLKRGLTSDQLGISGTPHTIYVNEHLTINNKQLFRETREAAKTAGYKYVWVKHSTILTRQSDNSPVLAIRSQNDIAKIKPKASTSS